VPLGQAFVDYASTESHPAATRRASPRRARRWTDVVAPIGSLGLLLAFYLGYRQFTAVSPRRLPERQIIPPRPLPVREPAQPKPLPVRQIIPPRPLPVREPAQPKPLPAKEAGAPESKQTVEDLPPEKPLPKNGDGVFRFKRYATTSALRIVPRSEQYHIIVKVENSKDGQLICWFLIRDGQAAETPIPPGTYRLKFAYGKRWYGEKHLFGPDASYSAIVNEITIPANTIQTLDLTPLPNGTLRENKIGPEDF
jgi:hypothetical protein